jgi:hypothetical protein
VLQVTLKEYFPPVVEAFQWLQNPFMFPLTEQGLLTKQYKELIDISTDTGLKVTYTNIPLINFWAGLKEEFPHISSVAVTKLLLFPSTYMCETAFSRYAATEMKYGTEIGLVHDTTWGHSFPKFVPDYNSLVASKQVTHPIR